MTDIAATARIAYEQGKDPIDWAIWLAKLQIETRDDIVDARLDDPGAYPIWGNRALDDESVACRIIGALIDAGWTPPDVGQKP